MFNNSWSSDVYKLVWSTSENGMLFLSIETWNSALQPLLIFNNYMNITSQIICKSMVI